MLGYAKRELVGMNISTVIPEPISSFHQAKLKAYIRHGREVRQAWHFVIFVLSVMVLLDKYRWMTSLLWCARVGYFFKLQLQTQRWCAARALA